MCWLILAEVYGLTVSPSGSTGKKICLCYCNRTSHSAQWMSHFLKLPQLRAHSALPAPWMTATFEATTMSSGACSDLSLRRFWNCSESRGKIIHCFLLWPCVNQNFGLSTEYPDTQKETSLLLNPSLEEVRRALAWFSEQPYCYHPNSPRKEVTGIQYLWGYVHTVFIGKTYSPKYFFPMQNKSFFTKKSIT